MRLQVGLCERNSFRWYNNKREKPSAGQNLSYNKFPVKTFDSVILFMNFTANVNFTASQTKLR